jgi:hypothetical protein
VNGKALGAEHAALIAKLVKLSLAAGTPSSRSIAALATRSGHIVSALTVLHVFQGRNIPKWQTIRAIVAGLSGDWLEVYPLWQAMHDATYDRPDHLGELASLHEALVDLVQVLDDLNARAGLGRLAQHTRAVRVLELTRGRNGGLPLMHAAAPSPLRRPPSEVPPGFVHGAGPPGS